MSPNQPRSRRGKRLVATEAVTAQPTEAVQADTPSASAQPPVLRLHVVAGTIQDFERLPDDSAAAVDAIALGFYVGVRPQAALRAIDRALSDELHARVVERNADANQPTPDEPYREVLREFIQRGQLKASLGQLFFFADPRPTGSAPPRVVTLAAMGTPGCFGQPELVIVARELCWALGMLGRKHLATVLIGAGPQNLSLAEAASGWLRGILRALEESNSTGRRLTDLTFVEFQPSRAEDLLSSLRNAYATIRRRTNGPQIAIDSHVILGKTSSEQVRRPLANESPETKSDPIPNRVIVEQRTGAWSLSALTETAAIPERRVDVDPQLIDEAVDAIAGTFDIARQMRYGRVLEALLIPKDLRDHLYGAKPLVVLVDSTTARVPWEMLCQPAEYTAFGADFPVESADSDVPADFLGLGRGLTRQLRTSFSLPPEPPLVNTRPLRILIVADPSRKAPLDEARREGEEVAQLFDTFNRLQELAGRPERIEVKKLIGYLEASRLDVLAEIAYRTYDVLHFCGHCNYDPRAPENSGWRFEESVLTARELTRLDRVPRFVFSNACKSGVTPDRSKRGASGWGASFAEAFFRQGVANFICTAWEVEEAAARKFALQVYASLLGIAIPAGASVESEKSEPAQSDSPVPTWSDLLAQATVVPPESMHESMLEARRAIFSTGKSTWGAYQHYGNPFFRLVSEESWIAHGRTTD